jgi:ABC-2 type transport system permease protein
MSDYLRAEWVKIRTAPGTGWLLLGVIAVTVLISATVSASVSCTSTAACHADVTKLSLTGTYLGQAIVAVLAVLAISDEYSTGMIHLTFTAMPRRVPVLAAKAAVLTALVFAAGVIAVLGSMLAGRLMLPGNGFRDYPSLASGPMLRAAFGTVLYLALIALLSLGLATAVREAAVAIGCVLGLLFLFPLITAFIGGNATLQRHLDQISPMTAGLYIQATTGLRSLPLTPWQGLGVLALWAVGALLLGSLILHWRDA